MLGTEKDVASPATTVQATDESARRMAMEKLDQKTPQDKIIPGIPSPENQQHVALLRKMTGRKLFGSQDDLAAVSVASDSTAATPTEKSTAPVAGKPNKKKTKTAKTKFAKKKNKNKNKNTIKPPVKPTPAASPIAPSAPPAPAVAPPNPASALLQQGGGSVGVGGVAQNGTVAKPPAPVAPPSTPRTADAAGTLLNRGSTADALDLDTLQKIVKESVQASLELETEKSTVSKGSSKPRIRDKTKHNRRMRFYRSLVSI